MWHKFIRFVCRHLPGKTRSMHLHSFHEPEYGDCPMDSSGSIQPEYSCGCVLVIDIIRIFGECSRRQIIFVQTFAAALYDSHVSCREQSLDGNSFFRFEMVADNIPFRLFEPDGTVSQYKFVGTCINHGRVCHESVFSGQ